MISFDIAGARVFTDTNFDGVIVCDDEDKIVVWNPSCERIFGWTREEALGRYSNDLIVPEDLKHLHKTGVKRLTESLKSGKGINPESNILDRRIEIDALRKNGSRFPVELAVSLYHENDMVYYVARIRDITEKRESDRMHEVMMHELNHRVRNSLAVVQSLVNNTLASDKVPQATITKVTERIGALGRAHSILSEENWLAGSLWSVISTAIAAHESQIDSHGPDVKLAATTVITTSLVLHELATNAIKYGALSNPEGRVNLTWFTAGNMVHMFWVEKGGPHAVKPQRTGFGTRMMQRLVTAETGASINFLYEPTGLKVELELPFFNAN